VPLLGRPVVWMILFMLSAHRGRDLVLTIPIASVSIRPHGYKHLRGRRPRRGTATDHIQPSTIRSIARRISATTTADSTPLPTRFLRQVGTGSPVRPVTMFSMVISDQLPVPWDLLIVDECGPVIRGRSL